MQSVCKQVIKYNICLTQFKVQYLLIQIILWHLWCNIALSCLYPILVVIAYFIDCSILLLHLLYLLCFIFYWCTVTSGNPELPPQINKLFLILMFLPFSRDIKFSFSLKILAHMCPCVPTLHSLSMVTSIYCKSKNYWWHVTHTTLLEKILNVSLHHIFVVVAVYFIPNITTRWRLKDKMAVFFLVLLIQKEMLSYLSIKR